MTFNLGGYPRNYVAMGDVAIAKIDPVEVAAAVKAGHSCFTIGPIIDASIDGHTLGETVVAKRGKVKLKLTVSAAAWISTTTITIIRSGGATLALRTLPRSTDVVRFDDTIPLDIAKDGCVIVHVDGDQPMAPNVGDLSDFRVCWFVLTNPIWIDADGDGKIAPRSLSFDVAGGAGLCSLSLGSALGCWVSLAAGFLLAGPVGGFRMIGVVRAPALPVSVARRGALLAT